MILRKMPDVVIMHLSDEYFDWALDTAHMWGLNIQDILLDPNDLVVYEARMNKFVDEYLEELEDDSEA